MWVPPAHGNPNLEFRFWSYGPQLFYFSWWQGPIQVPKNLALSICPALLMGKLWPPLSQVLKSSKTSHADLTVFLQQTWDWKYFFKELVTDQHENELGPAIWWEVKIEGVCFVNVPLCEYLWMWLIFHLWEDWLTLSFSVSFNMQFHWRSQLWN